MTPNLNCWYLSKCDGEWEHKYGITITTCDNPGWLVTLRLADTGIPPGDRILFQDGHFGENGEPCVDIRVRGDSLVGACSPDRTHQLDERLGEFFGMSNQ